MARSIIKLADGVPIKQIKALVRQEAKAFAIVQQEEAQIAAAEFLNSPLSPEEREEHEKRIENILNCFQNMAQASLEIWINLKWIRDNKTWRDKHDNFNNFCKNELGKDNSAIYRHLKDAQFKEELLLTAGDDTERTSIMSMKESNTRFIRTLPEDVQTAFWKLAYGIGINVLPKKDDGSIEPTTAFLEAVGARVDEIVDQGGIHIDGEFIPVTKIQKAAELVGVDETTAKAVLLSVGVSEEYFEAIKRQEQHIREKSSPADFLCLRGTIEHKIDVNGSDYPVLVDSKNNEYDLNDLLLSFNNRHITLSIKSPFRH